MTSRALEARAPEEVHASLLEALSELGEVFGVEPVLQNLGQVLWESYVADGVTDVLARALAWVEWTLTETAVSPFLPLASVFAGVAYGNDVRPLLGPTTRAGLAELAQSETVNPPSPALL